MLREVPTYDRPREKALEFGIKSLSNVELLAIILRTGSKDDDVITTAKKVLYSINDLSLLREISIEELKKIKGIGNTKAITLLASIELGLRIIESKRRFKIYENAEQVFNYYKPLLRNLGQEHLYAVYLNTKGMVISEQLITKGTISASLIDGRDILKLALKFSATAIILIHNHPSGDPTPSISDVTSTKKIIQQAKIMDIMIIDHIIIGESYFSMKKNSSIFKS